MDPDRLGIAGGSAGGHLSLMMGSYADWANSSAKDPVDRASSAVQAVACFFPPTDFLNYGLEGKICLDEPMLEPLVRCFSVWETATREEKGEGAPSTLADLTDFETNASHPDYSRRSRYPCPYPAIGAVPGEAERDRC